MSLRHTMTQKGWTCNKKCWHVGSYPNKMSPCWKIPKIHMYRARIVTQGGQLAPLMTEKIWWQWYCTSFTSVPFITIQWCSVTTVFLSLFAWIVSGTCNTTSLVMSVDIAVKWIYVTFSWAWKHHSQFSRLSFKIYFVKMSNIFK